MNCFDFINHLANGVRKIILIWSWPFAASYSWSRGTKPPSWRPKVALGQDKQKAYIILNSSFLCLSCPSITFCSPVRRFCTTWMASCTGPIKVESLILYWNWTLILCTLHYFFSTRIGHCHESKNLSVKPAIQIVRRPENLFDILNIAGPLYGKVVL